MYKKADAVAFLLAANAEVDKENRNSVTPLMAAVSDELPPP
jgi:ankyrin repeat protein